MRNWLLLLGGPLIWAAHFLAIYLATSASQVAVGATSGATRVAIIALSIGAGAGAILLAMHAWRRPHAEAQDAFWRTVSLAGAVLAIVAIIWQTLPVLAPIEGTAHSGSS
jgi:hypothetical protein